MLFYGVIVGLQHPDAASAESCEPACASPLRPPPPPPPWLTTTGSGRPTKTPATRRSRRRRCRHRRRRRRRHCRRSSPSRWRTRRRRDFRRTAIPTKTAIRAKKRCSKLRWKSTTAFTVSIRRRNPLRQVILMHFLWMDMVEAVTLLKIVKLS